MNDPVTITVPLIGFTPETQLMSALEAVVTIWLTTQTPLFHTPEPDHIYAEYDGQQREVVSRAVCWLHSKYSKAVQQ